MAALDFGVLSGVSATQIDGRSATDAVALEMTNTGRYEITPRAVLNQEIQKQGLTAPFSNIGIQRLGRSLGVDYVLTGDIVALSTVDNRVKVTLSVRLTDVVSGEFVNGAVNTGVSSVPPPGIEPDRQTQIGQAVSNASFLAVKAMNSFTLAEATVLNTSNSQIYLNRGSRDGLSNGLEMIVLRGREQVGKIRVTSTQATTALATVVEANKGIQPQDHARAVVKLPGMTVGPDGSIQSQPLPDISTYKIRQKNQKSVLSTVIGVVGAVLLVGFLFNSRNSNQGAGVVGVVARAYADGSVAASLDPSAARVEIRWQPAQDIPSNNIVEYHVWRNDQIIGVTRQPKYIDNPTDQGTVNYNIVVDPNQGNVQINATGTTAGGTTAGGTTAGGITAGGTTAGGTTAGGTTAGGTNNNGTTGINGSGTLRSASSFFGPMAVGVTHRYRVSVVYRAVQAPDLSTVTTSGGGGGIGGGGIGGGGIGGGGIGGGGGGIGGGGIGGGGIGGGGGGIGGGGIGGGGGGIGGGGGGAGGGTAIFYRESALEARSGAVTPLSRPQVTGPVSDQNLQRVVVAFRTTPGANQYVVEFASTPDFRRKVQKAPFFANFTLGADTRTDAYDLSTDFKDLKAGSRIYYRVGARNSLDTPGPLGQDTVNGDNYIYSQDLASFAKIGVPPAAP